MAIAAPTYTVKFDLTEDTPVFVVDDTTGYVAGGAALVDVRGCVTDAEDPLGNTLYANSDFDSPDIEPSSSRLFNGIDIPTDVNGDILEGDYSFTYGIVIDNPITAVNTGAKTFTIAGDYASEITSSGSIVVVRSTANDDTYTVVSAVYGGANTVITVSEVIPSATADGSIQYADQEVLSTTVEVTYSDVIAAIDINTEVDCFCGSFTSTDATSYGATATLTARTHTVVYPAALEKADVVSTSTASATIVVTPIYTKTWTTIVESTVEYDLGGGNTIEVIITGSKDTVVDCDLSLCEISCGVIALNNRYTSALSTNRVLAAEYYAQLTRVSQLIGQFQMQQQCGQNNQAAETLSQIRTAGNFTEDCGCGSDSDEPVQVVPLCGASGTGAIVSAGTGISVSTSGTTTVTYQVSISQAYLDIIAALSPVNVVGGTGVTVTETDVAGVQTFTIDVDDPVDPLNTQEARCLLEWSNFAAPTLTITTSNIVKEGSNMTDLTVANTTGTIGVGTWKFQNNLFTVSGFQASANSTYKPFVSAVVLETQTLAGVVTTQANQSTNTAPVDVRILNTGSGSFNFQLVDKSTGNPLTNYACVYTNKVLVNILIKE